jgi:hypothetical protein
MQCLENELKWNQLNREAGSRMDEFPAVTPPSEGRRPVDGIPPRQGQQWNRKGGAPMGARDPEITEPFCELLLKLTPEGRIPPSGRFLRCVCSCGYHTSLMASMKGVLSELGHHLKRVHPTVDAETYLVHSRGFDRFIKTDLPTFSDTP